MGAANSFKYHCAERRILTACISVLFAAGAAFSEEVKPKKNEPVAKKSKPHFASERPQLRPLFGKPHEEGVENNKFNDGGDITVSPVTLKSPRGTTGAPGFDSDPGGVTPPIFNPDPGAANAPGATQPAPTGPTAHVSRSRPSRPHA